MPAAHAAAAGLSPTRHFRMSPLLFCRRARARSPIACLVCPVPVLTEDIGIQGKKEKYVPTLLKERRDRETATGRVCQA